MKALKSLLIFSLVLFFSVIFTAEASAAIAAPKILKLVSEENLVITGTAEINNEVLIYLDGSFIGLVDAKNSLNNIEANFNFEYKTDQKLADGTHTVMAVSRDKTSMVLSAPSEEIKFTINILPAPTLVVPNESTITAQVKPLIIGLTRSGSLVKVFIDGVYNGKTEILYHESNTANFSYKPFLNLSRGWHQVYTIAEDSAGVVSQISNVEYFFIALPMPAPTILKTAAEENTFGTQLLVVGLAKNDSKIKVYIDKKYNGEFTVKNHASGVANFSYRPVKPLSRGNHLVYAVAIDKRGKQSEWSNIVYFSVKASDIAQSAQEAMSDTFASIEEPKEITSNDSEAPSISDTYGTIEKNADESQSQAVLSDRVEAVKKLSQPNEASLEKIKSIIGDNIEDKTETGQGMIDEGKINQGKLKLSLALFILFLVGVVAWLLWVNRELIKERQAQSETEDKKIPKPENQKNKLL